MWFIVNIVSNLHTQTTSKENSKTKNGLEIIE